MENIGLVALLYLSPIVAVYDKKLLLGYMGLLIVILYIYLYKDAFIKETYSIYNYFPWNEAN